MVTMPRYGAIILAWVLALVATVGGWAFALVWLDPRPMAMACWQPFIVVTGAREGPMILLSLVQFPLFATMFVLGSSRWPALRVALVLVAVYAGLVGWAMWEVHHGSRWGGHRQGARVLDFPVKK